MDIERLKTDHAYWDEVAPEGAEVYIIDHDPSVGGAEFYSREAGMWVGCLPAKSGSRRVWRRTDHAFLEVIPRPTAWRGPEDGLPPGGTRCEVGPQRKPCMIIGPHPRRGGLVYEIIPDEQFGWTDRASIFRSPLSDKERAVEAAMDVAGYLNSPNHPHSVEAGLVRPAFENAYDAGLLRLPEDTQ